MSNLIIDDNKREADEDNITKRLNKAFESRLDFDRVCVQIHSNMNLSNRNLVFRKLWKR